MYLLDTNVVSELRQAPGRSSQRRCRDLGGVRAFGGDVPLDHLGPELELGVLLAERSDPAKGRGLRAWLNDTVLPAFDGRILPVDHAVAVRSATLNVPAPAPYRDVFIGATALVHAMTVVTRNSNDFARFAGTAVLNPWT